MAINRPIWSHSVPRLKVELLGNYTEEARSLVHNGRDQSGWPSRFFLKCRDKSRWPSRSRSRPDFCRDIIPLEISRPYLLGAGRNDYCRGLIRIFTATVTGRIRFAASLNEPSLVSLIIAVALILAFSASNLRLIQTCIICMLKCSGIESFTPCVFRMRKKSDYPTSIYAAFLNEPLLFKLRTMFIKC